MPFDDQQIRSSIRDVPDYPKKGILFRDITPLLKNQELFLSCIDEFARRLDGRDIDFVAGIEARGFIIGTALAMRLGKGFVPLRKKGKLPYKTIEAQYDLEYGSATLEIHADALEKGDKVVIVDDLLATGGTAEAAVKLVGMLGASVVALVFLVELEGLGGRAKISSDVISLIDYR